jgi:hypothetical protein
MRPLLSMWSLFTLRSKRLMLMKYRQTEETSKAWANKKSVSLSTVQNSGDFFNNVRPMKK